MTQPIHPMLERVARAIYDRRAELRSENDRRLAKDGFWPDRHYQPSEIDLARAAVQALMEPDASMREVWSKDLWLSDRAFEQTWRSMLRPLVGEEK